jgi:DMSO reductase anchor subunit
MTRELGWISVLRFATGVVGGLFLPWLILSDRVAPGVVIGVLMLLLLLVGELSERYLFFAAAPASRMPGGLK